ncbi:MAG: hypothetical protein KME09_16195 [Pleurocapsa minor HA4230-MV1]|nr:hypothetical protein [Pleurocapsa minor HA4230-MV1]
MSIATQDAKCKAETVGFPDHVPYAKRYATALASRRPLGRRKIWQVLL